MARMFRWVASSTEKNWFQAGRAPAKAWFSPRFPLILGMLALLLALTVLVGWSIDSPVMKGLLPGLVFMNPMTAIGLAIAAVSLVAHSMGTPAVFTRAGGGLILALASLKLLSFLGWETGVDQWLFSGELDPVGLHPNRIAPNTNLNFFLVGTALFTFSVKPWFSQLCALTALLIALLAVTGYAYDISTLTQLRLFIPMALNTALGFTLVCLGIFFLRPGDGFMRVVTSAEAGGMLCRAVLPVLLVLQPALGWARLYGEKNGHYTGEFGVAIMVILSVAMISVLIYWSARLINEVEEVLHRQNLILSSVLNSMNEAVLVVDRGGRCLAQNPKSEMFGAASDLRIDLPREASPVKNAETGAPLPFEELPLVRALAGQNVEDLELRVEGGEGGENRFLSVSASPLRTQTDTIGAVLVARDVTERRRLTDELKVVNQELAKKVIEAGIFNRELESFSYSVSHDLRAPLRSMAGFSKIVMDTEAEKISPLGQDYLGRVVRAAERMGRLIDGLLELSRLSRKKIEKRPVPISRLAASIGEELKAAEPNRAVEFVIEPNLETQGDEKLIEAVLQNLLGNAWKFTAKKPHARIEVGHREREGKSFFFVKDNGAGFDMVYANKLFGAFQRLHSDAEFAGTGIGLATVQRIIHRHGGSVSAEGMPGEGACFYFSKT